jgi:hypothetical protein
MPDEQLPEEFKQPTMDNALPLTLPTWGEWGNLAIQVGMAFIFGCLVAIIYALTMRSPKRSAKPFLATLVMLSVLISLVTLVIGPSLARAFGLVGALSIVRFRTVVQDTRDTAFVIFAVIVGMGAGAGNVAVVLGMPFILLTALIFRTRRTMRELREAELVLRTSTIHSPGDTVRKMLAAHATSHRMIGVSTARGGASLEVSYLIHLATPEAQLTLVAELSRLEGVQSVEIKER